jgi:hypothetical protein
MIFSEAPQVMVGGAIADSAPGLWPRGGARWGES